METNGSDRLDRIERILEEVSKTLEKVAWSQTEAIKSHAEMSAEVDRRLSEMAARQQYHDEAFERFDVDMKKLRDAIEDNREDITALLRIAQLHDRRLNRLEGGEPT